MIISDPDPTDQLISDPDPDPERYKFRILRDPDPQHSLRLSAFFVRFFCKSAGGAQFTLKIFLCCLPMAGDSYWSSKCMNAAATDL